MVDIAIEDVILQHTNKTISTATYAALRQYLLEKKPLGAVTGPIDTLLSEHFTKERELFNKSVIQSQIEQQIQQDIQEIRTDKQEEAADKLLKEEYKRTIPLKQQVHHRLVLQYTMKETYYKQISSELSGLEIELAGITNRLDDIAHERQSLHFQWQQIPTHVHLTNVHTHHHSHVFQDPFLLEEQSLTVRKNNIGAQIARKSTEKATEGAILQKLDSEKNQLLVQIETLNRSLNTDLPRRAQERQSRLEGRAARKEARDTGSTDVQRLLSAHNQQYLQTQILSKFWQCKKEITRLKVTVQSTSYHVYLTQLELRLQQEEGLQINPSERQTLSMILNLLKNLQTMRDQERSLSTLLTEKHSKLADLEKTLADTKIELTNLAESSRKLAEANNALRTELHQLSGMMNSAGNYYVHSAGVSIGSGASSLIVTGVMFIGTVFNPLLFIMPAAFGLFALIAMTIAIVKYSQKNGFAEQIRVNQQTTVQNEATIREQKQKINELNQVTIPSIHSKIEACKAEISQLELKLGNLQSQIGQLDNMSQKVNLSSGSFFGGGLSGVLPTPVPNTPPPAYALPASTYSASAPNFFAGLPPTAPPEQPHYSYKAPPPFSAGSYEPPAYGT